MAIEILGTGQPDGTGVVKATSEKLSFYGGTAVSQAVSMVIASIDEMTSTKLNVEFAKINTLIGNLEDLGIIASA